VSVKKKRKAAGAMTKREKPWRRHLKTTREGKAFIAVTFGVGLAAFNTGNNLIFLMLGFMLSLIVLSGILSETAIRGIRVKRRPPERAFAGSTALVELELFNKKKRVPSYSLEVEDLAEASRSERRCYFLKVGANSRQVAGYRRIPERRGFLRFSGFRVATRYPFGIFEKWRNLYVPGEMLVYPALLPEGRDTRVDYTQGTERPMGRVGPGTEIVGLRDYVPGDEARNIHWMRTAALGRLVVRERERDASSHLTITLDNARPASAGEEWEGRFEHAISRAATIAVSSVSRGVSVEVVSRGSRSPVVPPGSPADPILRYLALLQGVSAEEDVAFAPKTRVSREVEVRLGADAAGDGPDGVEPGVSVFRDSGAAGEPRDAGGAA
jgi:uncharacterized protein (DUF58 family)